MTSTAVHAKIISQQSSSDKTYTFSSYPRALLQQCLFSRKSRYREQAKLEEQLLKYGNIMYDRRVMRGTTVPYHTVSVGVPLDKYDIEKQYAVRRRVIGRRPVRAPIRTLSPPPVQGRKHMEVQTELFLEELAAAVEVYDEECQTDAFLDRPASPLFVRAKSGIDVETQIYEGELFDFDHEVVPILQVLVGKTVEQSLLEVVQEEELANLREQQQRFEQLRKAQLVEEQRLEEQERRLSEEKERRLDQHKKAVHDQRKTAEKVAACAFSQNYLADLAPTVFQNLMDTNYFFDPVARDIEQDFMPWLMNEVAAKLSACVLERAIIDEIVSEIVMTDAKKFRPLTQELPREKASDLDLEDITALEETAVEESVGTVDILEMEQEMEEEWEAEAEEEELGEEV